MFFRKKHILLIFWSFLIFLGTIPNFLVFFLISLGPIPTNHLQIRILSAVVYRPDSDYSNRHHQTHNTFSKYRERLSLHNK